MSRPTQRWLAACWLLTLCVTGCTGSRWARNHPDYASKYPHHTENLARVSKQAVDARHLAGDSGMSLGLAARDNPFAAGATAEGFYFPDWYRGALELHGGFSGLLAEGQHPVSGGLLGGIRMQTPTRLAPFVGVGAYGGWVPDVLAGNDGIDNNGNGFIDESFEENEGFVLAAYPEAGVHFWLTSHVRLTASASHYFTTINDNSDFTLYGISLSFLSTDEVAPVYPPTCSDTIDDTPQLPLPEITNPTSQDWPSTPWPPAGTPVRPKKASNPAYEALVLPAESE